MRVFDDTAKVLDANYSIEPDGTRLALIMDSRSGRTRTTGKETNRDYNIALQRLLERLGGLDATLVDGFVESDTTRRLGIPEAERRIVDPAKPIRLADEADMEKFRQELGTAQSKVAQSPTSTRPGNATRRIRLLFDVPGFEAGHANRLADILSTRGGDFQGPPASSPPRLGSVYRQGEVREGAGARDPFSTDPALIERGLRGHASTQNELAQVLREAGIEPRSPLPGEPNYDLAWQAHDATCVAEVKSITDDNEDLQLRLGLGQVLWYRHRLAGLGYQNVIAVLVPERRPRDTVWEELCSQLGVVLLSKGELEQAPLLGLRADEGS
jgi:hypothetical protein